LQCLCGIATAIAAMGGGSLLAGSISSLCGMGEDVEVFSER
jgi:hypothetical protein